MRNEIQNKIIQKNRYNDKKLCVVPQKKLKQKKRYEYIQMHFQKCVAFYDLEILMNEI